MLGELYLVWMIILCWEQKLKYSTSKKKVDRYLKNENNDPCKIYEGFYCGKPCDFNGNKCNNAGLNKVINNILTGKRDLGFSLKLTNATVIELYHYMINNNYTWKLLRKTLLSIKSSLTAKKKTDDLKIFENTDFMLPDSCVFIANNIESATISSSNNENEFDVLSDSIDTLTDRLQEECQEK